MDSGEQTASEVCEERQAEVSDPDYDEIEAQIRTDTTRWQDSIPSHIAESGFLKQCAGTIELLHGKAWLIKGHPHFITKAKNIFKGSSERNIGFLLLSNKKSICKELAWILQRYKLYFHKITDALVLYEMARQHDEMIVRLEDIMAGDYTPRPIELAKPPREYQSLAANVILDQGYLLVGDEVGLGKTVTSICTFTDKRTLPAAVVTLSGTMPDQWKDEINEFAPDLRVYIPKTTSPKEFKKIIGRKPDVIALNYHKLHGWSELLGEYCNSVVFDEIQELRREESAKYAAAEYVSRRTNFRTGLSATPIYNYGSEIYNVLNILNPGMLGERTEFIREWCVPVNNKWKLADPKAFGTYMREQFMMVRRTRKDVKRELPPLTKIPYMIECDEKELDRIAGDAAELASIIVAGNNEWKGQQMNAGGQLDNLMRQATGIAKAPFIAAFLKMLIEDGQTVLCGLWHHQVYDIILDLMKEDDIPVAMYTGRETPAKKKKEKARFMNGEAPLMLMSNRAGAGLDGIQKVCNTVVIGELDWSPGIYTQFIGRVFRDGQPYPVNAWFLHTNDGADPIMMEVNGIKKEQVDGIIEPEKDIVEQLQINGKDIRELAKRILLRQRKH